MTTNTVCGLAKINASARWGDLEAQAVVDYIEGLKTSLLNAHITIDELRHEIEEEARKAQERKPC